MDSRTRFQIALSYRDKARGPVDAAGDLETEAAAPDHLQRAENVLRQLRADENKELKNLEHAAARIRAKQERLIRRVQQGRLAPESANNQNREFLERANDLKGLAAVSRACLEAQNAQGLGGAVDLPLEELARKLTARTEIVSAPPRVLRAAMAGLAALVVFTAAYAVYALLDIWQGAGLVAFEARSTGRSTSAIEVVCKNGSARSVSLFAPWPEQRETGGGGLQDLPRFGIALYVREAAGGAFRLFPNSEGCWFQHGFPLIERGPLELPPGISTTVVLDMVKLRELGVDPVAVRLDFTRSDGRKMGSFEAALAGNEPRRPGR